MDAITKQLSNMTVDLVQKLDLIPLDDMPKANEYLREFVVHARKLIYSSTNTPINKEIVLDIKSDFERTKRKVSVLIPGSSKSCVVKAIIAGNFVYIPVNEDTVDVRSGTVLTSAEDMGQGIIAEYAGVLEYIVLSRSVVFAPSGDKYYLCNIVRRDEVDA